VERIISAKPREEDFVLDKGLRPRQLVDFIGQDKVKENLSIGMTAAQGRGEALDHTLLYGPPGLGKTTLAYIIAAEMGVNIKITSGPAIERPGDLAAIITNLNKLDLVIGKGAGAKSVRLNLPRFTLIGATTRFAMLSPPLRDRFGAVYRLDFYGQDAIKVIVSRSARLLGLEAEEAGLEEIAKRARGTPRVANRLLKRVRDYAEVKAQGVITEKVAIEALGKLEIDSIGLDEVDHRILHTIIEKFNGGPVGLDTIAAAISEEADTIMDVYEPYLMQLSFLERTPRGRVATRFAYEHLGLTYPKDKAQQAGLW